jgi:hypothetical protein
VKTQELSEGEGVDDGLDVAAAEVGGQLAGEHPGIASRAINVGTACGQQGFESFFEAGDVLNLVDKDISKSLGFGGLTFYIGYQVAVVPNFIKLMEFFIDVNNPILRDTLLPQRIHDLVKKKALADPPLAYEDFNNGLPYERRKSLKVFRPLNIAFSYRQRNHLPT